MLNKLLLLINGFVAQLVVGACFACGRSRVQVLSNPSFALLQFDLCRSHLPSPSRAIDSIRIHLLTFLLLITSPRLSNGYDMSLSLMPSEDPTRPGFDSRFGNFFFFCSPSIYELDTLRKQQSHALVVQRLVHCTCNAETAV